MASFGLGRPQTATSTPSIQIDASSPWMAASEGNLNLLQASLQAQNLNPNSADEQGYTLLHAAAAYNQRSVMEWLLQQEDETHCRLVNVNAVDNDGDSALHHVERVEAARFLIEKGRVNPNLANGPGKTALQMKQEELAELMQNEDEDDEDVIRLRELIAYLAHLVDRQ